MFFECLFVVFNKLILKKGCTVFVSFIHKPVCAVVLYCVFRSSLLLPPALEVRAELQFMKLTTGRQ